LIRRRGRGIFGLRRSGSRPQLGKHLSPSFRTSRTFPRSASHKCFAKFCCLLAEAEKQQPKQTGPMAVAIPEFSAFWRCVGQPILNALRYLRSQAVSTRAKQLARALALAGALWPRPVTRFPFCLPKSYGFVCVCLCGSLWSSVWRRLRVCMTSSFMA
jgi:hypothetical protein